ncbi:MAG: thioredoxin domain-containing protein [Flavobacterium sp. MedPE-SWcel]|uniref:thioredoxin domain-containing protein n=1 Tax=uncultured Flavobacterium sp. TaxID=165435 RepID=UPI0009193911|nr:thioredoxin domain-containing protein [uncultured Flavobacterium sp.]OIQ22005.1 MAG: thioredoxin domain-containing protein [Flavobacterium sp. MedPE-SWcel]
MKYIHFLLLITLISCKGQNTKSLDDKHTNDLIHETSPYLLQHAHNPVNWNAWNDEVLAKAKTENKLILISVGYSACHWCHVMEHESFEDISVAKVMNDNFINIKVDREERPDVDKVYMNAVQLMTGSGGWPMNVIALPDGRPIWGGTYFRKKEWVSALNQISKVYTEDPDTLYEYADKLEQGIKSLDIVQLNTNEPVFNKGFIKSTVKKWSRHFDPNNGGTNRAPKFMMPNNLHFLLRYAYQTNDVKLQNYVNLTLTKIAYGGVFDQIGGGFSRYSVDNKWHVPHFEKMLYDNGQLVSLYADAYLITKNKLYKDVVIETLKYAKRNMTTDNGAFYSSLDADSNNTDGNLEEGAFYVWNKVQLKHILGEEDFKIFKDYYNINNYGHWEHGKYVLIRKDDDASIIKKHNITSVVLAEKKAKWKNTLLKERNKRDHPRLDDKTLTSWNALMLKGYIDAYRVLGDKDYLAAAKKNADFIINNQLRKNGGLNHSYKNGKSTVNGYLEDYATTIDAFIALYENTLDEKWLTTARDLATYTFNHFYDENNKMFYFTSSQDKSLISRNMEYRDNVIPASNSIMAKNLFKLSHYFDDKHFSETAMTMLNNVKPEIQKYPSGYSNWLDLMLNYTNPYYEVAIVGNNAQQKLAALNRTYIPNKLIVGSTIANDKLPLLQNRYDPNKTLIYVCVNKACKIPVEDVNKAILLLNE